MSKRFLLVAYILLAVFFAILLAATVVASCYGGDIWHGAWIVTLFSAFAFALLISVIAYNPKKGLYSVGFYLMHSGLVFFISGMLMFTFFGHSVLVSPPSVSSITEEIQAEMLSDGAEIPNGYYNRIPGKDGGIADLGFNFRITDFVTEYYDNAKSEVKHYEATIAFLDGDTESPDFLTVNHPIYKNGWKIYLMSVSENPQYGYDEITLMFKRDPGEILSTTGIILSILGAFAMCLPKKRKAVKDDD